MNYGRICTKNIWPILWRTRLFQSTGTLDIGHVERLFLLFDNFETLNGSRDRIDTEILTQVFKIARSGKKSRILSDRYVIKFIERRSMAKRHDRRFGRS